MSLELSLDWLRAFLIWVQGTGIYWFALFYFAAYPIVTSIMWITTSWMFRIRWEEESDEIVAPKTGWPMWGVATASPTPSLTRRRA